MNCNIVAALERCGHDRRCLLSLSDVAGHPAATITQLGGGLLEHLRPAPGAKTARLISRHRCHILWPHKTALAEITVKELP